jgi:tRNA threonylcarbamoyl adenosine modification protein YeaZ
MGKIQCTFLGFDCSAGVGSVALRVNESTESITLAVGKQAAALVPAMESLMQQTGLHYKDLTAIVTTLGPGSFTSLRVALATAHGLCLATGVELRTLTTTAAYAWQAASDCDVILNAGKGEVFYQSFRWVAGKPVSEGDIQLLKPAQLPQRHTSTVGNIALPDRTGIVATLGAATLCRIAYELEPTPLAEAMPLYIRPPDAKLPVGLEAGS